MITLFLWWLRKSVFAPWFLGFKAIKNSITQKEPLYTKLLMLQINHPCHNKKAWCDTKDGKVNTNIIQNLLYKYTFYFTSFRNSLLQLLYGQTYQKRKVQKINGKMAKKKTNKASKALEKSRLWRSKLRFNRRYFGENVSTFPENKNN